MIKFSTATDGSNHLALGDTSYQVVKLSPKDFSSFPPSNVHRQWKQVPGYRIILIREFGTADPQTFIDWYLKEKIEKYPQPFKRYKLSIGI